MDDTGENFDTILKALKTGKWNLYILLIVASWECFLPGVILSGAFTVPKISHTCTSVDPQDGTNTNTNTNIPVIFMNDTSLPTNDTEDEDDKWSCSLPGEGSKPCTRWAYNTSIYGFTITEEFDLVCHRSYLRGIYNSMFYFGAFSSASMSGWLSDNFGRKKVYFAAAATFSVVSNLMPWMPNLTVILLCKFILGTLFPSCAQGAYTLMMEGFEERWRSTAGIIVFLPWCIGMMLFGGVTSQVLHWRWRSFYLTLPNVVLVIMMWFLDESPRWLIVRGRHTEALKVLNKAARWNKTTLPPAEKLQSIFENMQQKPAATSSSSGKSKWRQVVWRVLDAFLVLVRTRRMRKITLTVYALFFITSMGYVGLSLGGDLFSPDDPYLYMVFSGLVEVPGSSIIAPIVEKFGRKKTNVVFYGVTGVTLLAMSFTPAGHSKVVMSLALIGKLTLTAANQVIYLNCSELFPTEIRSWGMANATMVSRFSAILTSFFVSVLPTAWSVIAPSVLFGCACVLASALTLLLPETTGKALYDTVAALEAKQTLGADKKDQEESLTEVNSKRESSLPSPPVSDTEEMSASASSIPDPGKT